MPFLANLKILSVLIGFQEFSVTVQLLKSSVHVENSLYDEVIAHVFRSGGCS